MKPWTEHACEGLPNVCRVMTVCVTYLQVTSSLKAGTCERRDTRR